MVSGVITASNFAKADGSSLGGFEPDSNENLYGGTSSGEDVKVALILISTLVLDIVLVQILMENLLMDNLLMGHKALCNHKWW